MTNLPNHPGLPHCRHHLAFRLDCAECGGELRTNDTVDGVTLYDAAYRIAVAIRSGGYQVGPMEVIDGERLAMTVHARRPGPVTVTVSIP